MSQRTKAAMAAAAATMAGASLLLSGCSVIDQFRHLPDEERYMLIEEAKVALDLKSAGQILEIENDVRGGGLEASWSTVTLEGENAFAILSERLRAASGSDCGPKDPQFSIDCHISAVDVRISRGDTRTPGNDVIHIRFIDNTSGKGLG